jgi:hypothetical protein
MRRHSRIWAVTAGAVLAFLASLLSGLRRRRLIRPPGRGQGREGPPDAGVREPRRPPPFAGAGAAAIAEPGTGLDQ